MVIIGWRIMSNVLIFMSGDDPDAVREAEREEKRREKRLRDYINDKRK